MRASLIHLRLCTGALLVWGVLAVHSNATSINYGDFSGSSVMYLDVTEAANSPGDAPPLFGAPAIFGDTLDFNPTGFSAGASDGSTDLTDGQLTLGIMAQSGLVIDSLVVSESGDYSLLGFTPNSAGAGVTGPFLFSQRQWVLLFTTRPLYARTYP